VQNGKLDISNWKNGIHTQDEGVRAKLQTLVDLLAGTQGCVIACSGGVDSMLLATVGNYALGERCMVVHAVSPAVPEEDTRRVREYAAREGWNFKVARTGEFDDENYLSNPIDRCYYCKSNLFDGLIPLAQLVSQDGSPFIFSGANVDDLGEYRPGLKAASKYGVRHPFIEAGIGKQDVRAICHALGLSFAEIPASPCLASRIYTGTRVTEDRLAAVHLAEKTVKDLIAIQVVRCRIKEDHMLIEVQAEDRLKISDDILGKVRAVVCRQHPFMQSVELDPLAYTPGRAFTVS